MLDNSEYRGRTAVGLCAFLMAAACSAAVPGKTVSGDYLMRVDGRPVEVIRVPMPEPSGGCIQNRLDWQPYSYAPFVATGTVEVCVQSGDGQRVSKSRILRKLSQNEFA